MHRSIDVFVTRGWVAAKECGGCHDLPALAVTALRNLFFDPGFLHRMRVVGGKTLNRCHGLIADRCDRNGTGPDGDAVEVNGAGAALCDTAAVFSAGKSHDVTNGPEQGHFWIDIDWNLFLVDEKCECCHNGKRMCRGKLDKKCRELFTNLVFVRNRFWLVAFALCVAYNGAQAQVRVEVIVLNVKDTTGMIRVGIFADPQAFMKKPILGKIVKAAEGRCVAVFERVPTGTYAISVIHDSNRNEKLDTNFFGIPKEGFGFSNDVMGTFGPPSFDKAKVTVEASTSFGIHVRYP